MTTDELLSILSDREVTLYLESGELRYRAPEDAMTPSLLRVLRLHKLKMLERLKAEEKTDNARPFDPAEYAEAKGRCSAESVRRQSNLRKCAECGRELTRDEYHYYGNRCEPCERGLTVASGETRVASEEDAAERATQPSAVIPQPSETDNGYQPNPEPRVMIGLCWPGGDEHDPSGRKLSTPYKMVPADEYFEMLESLCSTRN